jgi:hypothetical protein
VKRRGGGPSKASLDALESIASGARRARLGERLPEDRRPTPAFVVSIGLGPREDDEEEDEEKRPRKG